MFNLRKISAESTAFHRKAFVGHRIPGTKMSYQNVQLLTSTGVTSLDSYLGGGVATGTVLLVEEDHYNTYASILVKYFLAEGVKHSHSILLASGNTPPKKILKELPAAVEPKQPLFKCEDSVMDLKIAWRYKEQSAAESASTHSFDLSKTMSKEKITEANILTFNPSSCEWIDKQQKGFLKEPFESLFAEINGAVKQEELQLKEKQESNVLRIVIPSFGSPLWMDNSDTDMYALLRFLYMLRSLLRSSYATALVTVPKTLLQNNPMLHDKVCQMCDYVIQMESFALLRKSENNPMIKDFDGLINIVKLPVLNTFIYQTPAMDLAFKLHRKTFHVEQFCLPPDVEEISGDAPACGGSSLLDF